MAENTFANNLNFPLMSGDTKGGLYEFNRAMLIATMNGFLVTISRERSAPPANPSDGDAYFVLPQGAVDTAWENQGNNIAYFYSGWTFITPKIGMRAWNLADNTLYIFNNDGWQGGTAIANAGGGDILSVVQGIIDDTLTECRLFGLILP